MKKLMRGGLAVVISLSAAACDSGVTEVTGDQLSAEEAMALAGSVVDVGYSGLAGEAEGTDPGTQGALMPQAEGTSSHQFTVTAACPRGGEVQVAGASTAVWNQATQSLVVEIGSRTTHVDCGVDARGTVLELNGAPHLETTARFAWAEGVPAGEQRMTLEGAFDWAGPEREGRCTVELAATFDLQAGKRTLRGTFCGVELDSTVTWSPQD